jgi:hypothetical protein
MNCYNPTIAASGTGGRLKALTLTFFWATKYFHHIQTSEEHGQSNLKNAELLAVDHQFVILPLLLAQVRRRRNLSTGENRPPPTGHDGWRYRAQKKKGNMPVTYGDASMHNHTTRNTKNIQKTWDI